jgi:hypothetical protein
MSLGPTLRRYVSPGHAASPTTDEVESSIAPAAADPECNRASGFGVVWFDLVRSPGRVEVRRERVAEPKDRVGALARHGLEPVAWCCHRGPWVQCARLSSRPGWSPPCPRIAMPVRERGLMPGKARQGERTGATGTRPTDSRGRSGGGLLGAGSDVQSYDPSSSTERLKAVHLAPPGPSRRAAVRAGGAAPAGRRSRCPAAALRGSVCRCGKAVVTDSWCQWSGSGRRQQIMRLNRLRCDAYPARRLRS